MGSSSVVDPAPLHQALVDQLKHQGLLRTPALEEAFREVARHPFLPELSPEAVYLNQPLPIKWRDRQLVSSSSQPTIMALMLEQLQIRPGHRVLEIGTGTGYNAAILDHLVGPLGQVISVEVEEDVVRRAATHLARTGHERVQVVHGQGQSGVADAAPFDRILVTASSWDIPPAWWQQLRIGGRLVLPLSLGGPQASIGFQKIQPFQMRSESILQCGFVPLQGDPANDQILLPLQIGESQAQLRTTQRTGKIFASDLETGLHPGSSLQITSVNASVAELWEGLEIWLALGTESFCSLQGEADSISRLFVIFADAPSIRNFGVLEPEILSLVVGLRQTTGGQIQLGVRSFGPRQSYASLLLNQIQKWNSQDRPRLKDLQIEALPIWAPFPNNSHAMLRFTRYHSRFEVLNRTRNSKNLRGSR